MSEGKHQIGDKSSGDKRPEDPSHPGMSPDPAERGRELGEANAHGDQCVGTGGHGTTGSGSGDDINQPVGGINASSASHFSQQELHPGMNPDPAERGRELGEENARGGQCVGTGGHGGTSGGDANQPVGGKHASHASHFSQQELHPGMNPDPAKRGRQLGEENARGGHSVGTGGHGPSGANMGK